MRFVHTADNHLDSPIASIPPQKAQIRRDMRLASFSKIIDYTIKSADALLISGDLFDSPNPPRSVVEFVKKEFARLSDIPVFIALGNHDYLKESFDFPGNVHIFPESFETVAADDCLITGASFASPSGCFSGLIPAPSGNSFSILLLHGDIFTKSDYNSMDKDYLSSLGYDYIALGHIHEFFEYKNIRYPGCHDGSGFDETGIKGFIYGDTSSRTYNFIPSSSLVYSKESFDVSACYSSAEIADALMAAFPDGIYKFTLTGTPREGFTPNASAIEGFISQKFFHSSVTDNTNFDTSITTSMLYKLFSDYVTAHSEGEISSLALRYGTNAMKGDISI